jgi:hypothetical protein
MSWQLFKSTLLPVMESKVFGNDISSFSKTFTNAYDIAIRTGGDTINRIPVMNGNVLIMESTLTSLLLQTQLSNTIGFLDVIGPAIISYWSGAQMMRFPPPIIPAIGAISNITTTSGLVISPGVWTSIPVPPSQSSEPFINSFITSAKIHLTTVSGMYVVISQYPPPTPPAPGIVMWSGYSVSD